MTVEHDLGRDIMNTAPIGSMPRSRQTTGFAIMKES